MHYKIKFIILIFALGTLNVHAQSKSISLSAKNTPIKEVLTEIQQKSGYRILYNDEVVKDEMRVTVNAEKVSVKQLLETILRNKGLTYVMNQDNLIVIKAQSLDESRKWITGTVVDENDNPIQFANVIVKSLPDSTFINATSSDMTGAFKLERKQSDKQMVEISYLGYKTFVKENFENNLGKIRLTIDNKVLKEVVVKADMQKASPHSLTFIPSVKQKSSSQNAIDLLRQLALPQLNINLVNNAVTTPTGDKVAIFINYMTASKEEMEGILTSDVRRVEYLDFPLDPRFNGSEHVIHFIMHKYQYGGYTKVSASTNLLSGISNKASIYSKFAYKKMIYDLYAGSSNYNLHNIGTSTIGKYKLTDNNGQPTSITRKEIFEKAHNKGGDYPITFRAIYDTEKMQIANTLGFSFSNTSMAETSGNLSYEPSVGNAYGFMRNNPMMSRLFIWSGSYYFNLHQGVRLNIAPYASRGHIKDNSFFSTTLPDAMPIENNAEEEHYRYGITSTVFKKLKDIQSIFLRAFYGVTKNDVQYFGTSPYVNKFSERFAGAAAGYNFANKKWNFNTDLSFQWEENKINEKSIKEIYPLFNISAGYSPSSKHSFRTYFHYGANYPGAGEKTPNILRENERMYKTGNPDMGLSRQITYNLSYNWIPNNSFSTSVYSQYYGESNLYVPVFKTYENETALLRMYETDGQYHRTQLGVSFNYKALEGKLQFAASPSITLFRMSGYYNISKDIFSCNTSMTYYLSDFYFQASYQTPFRTIQGNRAVYNVERSFYQMQIGWSKNNLNIRVSGNNLLRNDWLCSTQTLYSPLYSETKYLEGNNYHRRVNISMTYTFGYGKKVNRNNEVGEQYGGNSAILK